MELYGGGLEILVAGMQHVEQLCNHRWIVGVTATDYDPATAGAITPETRGTALRIPFGADFQGQLQAETKDGEKTILKLTATLAGSSPQAGGLVDNHHGGFHFIAVLTSGTAAA